MIRRMANPQPRAWPGPWFEFSHGGKCGSASYRMLPAYIGLEAFWQLRERHAILRRLVRTRLHAMVECRIGGDRGYMANKLRQYRAKFGRRLYRELVC